jgi:hypothetical protein
MPAKPRIVEVDHRGARSVDQHVARMQVCVDQAERGSWLAIAGQCRMQSVPRAEKPLAFDGGEYGIVLERFRPHQPIGIECVPLESGGRCPACRLVMHRRHDGANALAASCR